MNTQLLICIKANKQLVKLVKYFTDFKFRGSRLLKKYPENWMMRKFCILGYIPTRVSVIVAASLQCEHYIR